MKISIFTFFFTLLSQLCLGQVKTFYTTYKNYKVENAIHEAGITKGFYRKSYMDKVTGELVCEEVISMNRSHVILYLEEANKKLLFFYFDIDKLENSLDKIILKSSIKKDVYCFYQDEGIGYKGAIVIVRNNQVREDFVHFLH